MKSLAEVNKVIPTVFRTNNGYNIMLIKTDKFKTNSINLFIHDQLDRSTATRNALLPSVLKRGNRDYGTMQELSKKLEELYGSSFNCGVVKKGERQILHFYIDGVNDNYIGSSEKLFNKCAEVLNSVISKPLIQDGRFRQEYVEQEREKHATLIESRINDKVQYAVDRCYELMCSNEKYGIYELGKVEDLKEIDGLELADRYRKLVTNAKIDIVVVGDVDSQWAGKLEEIIDIKTDSNIGLAKEEISKDVADIRTFVEEMDVSQGKLSMGFRTNVDPTDPDYYSLIVYSSILGGGAHSKLHQNVREKASLAYYAFARLEKLKGLMMISSGIEAGNFEKAKEIIIRQTDDMREGRISDVEFDSSVRILENGLRAMSDEPLQMADFFLVQSILGTNNDFESVIDKIKKVKIDDVARVAKKIQLDTVLFLKPKEVK